MEHGTANGIRLTERQIQAVRRNKLEHRRLERQVTLMRDEMQRRLARLQRQARYLQNHYTNVVRVVKTNRRYQLWKEAHAHEIEQAERQKRLEEVKFRQRSKRETYQPVFVSHEISQTSTRPLHLIYNGSRTTPVRNFPRPATSSIPPKCATDPGNPNRSQSSRPKTLTSLPLIVSASSRRLNQEKCVPAASEHRIVKGIV